MPSVNSFIAVTYGLQLTMRSVSSTSHNSSVKFTFFPLEARSLFLCPEPQRKQKAPFQQEFRKCKELSSQFLYLSFLTTLSAHLCGKPRQVLIDNFCVSTLCNTGGFLPSFCFKARCFVAVRYFSAFIKQLNCLPHFVVPTLYQLSVRQSIAAGWTVLGSFMGWICFTDDYGKFELRAP